MILNQINNLCLFLTCVSGVFDNEILIKCNFKKEKGIFAS